MIDLDKSMEDYYHSGDADKLKQIVSGHRHLAITSLINDIESAMIDMDTETGNFVIDGEKYIDIKRKYTQ